MFILEAFFKTTKLIEQLKTKLDGVSWGEALRAFKVPEEASKKIAQYLKTHSKEIIWRCTEEPGLHRFSKQETKLPYTLYMALENQQFLLVIDVRKKIEGKIVGGGAYKIVKPNLKLTFDLAKGKPTIVEPGVSITSHLSSAQQRPPWGCHEYKLAAFEFQLMQALNHPNIHKPWGRPHLYYNKDKWKATMFSKRAMCTLAGFLEKKGATLSTEEKLDLQSQMASAVAYLHDNGIYHLDIKPENVLVFRDGNRWRLELTDFGAAYLDPDKISDFLSGLKNPEKKGFGWPTIGFESPRILEYFEKMLASEHDMSCYYFANEVNITSYARVIYQCSESHKGFSHEFFPHGSDDVFALGIVLKCIEEGKHVINTADLVVEPNSNAFPFEPSLLNNAKDSKTAREIADFYEERLQSKTLPKSPKAPNKTNRVHPKYGNALLCLMMAAGMGTLGLAFLPEIDFLMEGFSSECGALLCLGAFLFLLFKAGNQAQIYSGFFVSASPADPADQPVSDQRVTTMSLT